MTEPVGSASLEDLAVRLAATPVSSHQVDDLIAPKIKAVGRALTATEARVTQLAGERRELEHPAEWLLDNVYIIRDAWRQVRSGLPRRYRRELPKLTLGPLAHLPRAYAIARALADAGGGFVDVESAAGFIRAYQQHTVLTIGELWALPTFLRLVVLEDLAALAESALEPSRPGVADVDRSRLETRIAGCITSLRRIAAHDWKSFFESLSVVDVILRDDALHAYERMDFAARDAYRKVVEQLARWSGRDEVEVARYAVSLAADGRRDAVEGRRAHVGYYLIDVGRSTLEQRLSANVPRRVRVARIIKAHAVLVYLSAVALLTGALLAISLSYLFGVGGTISHAVVWLLVSVIPAITVAVPIVNWVITHAIPPHMIPRLDFEENIPAAYKTVVAVPTLLTSVDDVHTMLRQLEVNYQGNSQTHLTFALLTDGPDAPEPELDDDAELLRRTAEGVRILNARYGTSEHDQPFVVLHRERRWNASEGCWMGWERKRGKLHELNRLLLGDSTTTLRRHAGSPAALQNVRFVITLDADTVLPRGTAHRLVAALAHPLNRPEFNSQGNVVAGYTVLQPRLETTLKSAAETRFSRIFEGDTGLDLYTHAVSDVHFDFFGEGIYAGKGIYDVAAFEQSLGECVPENALLSHDLFEGIHGRAGFVSDVQLLEDYPSHVVGHARRLHRWVRGDWQLLPWLWNRVPTADGHKTATRLSVLNRWKIFDNIRRSLIAPALIAAFLVGWLWLPPSTWFWTLIVAATLAMPVIIGAATSANRLMLGSPVRPTFSRAVWSIRADASRWTLGLVFLAYEASTVLDAIVRTVARLIFTHRHLLEWQAAAHTERAVSGRASAAFVWRQMAASPAFAFVVGTVAWLLGPATFTPAIPLLVSWFFAPLVAHKLSQPLRQPVPHLDTDGRRQLRCLSRRTWHYFERVLGPDDAWIAPDHFQEEPGGFVARRTSPTNIGMGLLSTLAAYDMGYLGLTRLAATLSRGLETVDHLDRFRGHFYNWYDTETLSPLNPRYVSVVDSGNLAASLIALQNACAGLLNDRLVSRSLWQGIADTASVLCDEIRMAFPKTSHHDTRVGKIVDALEEIRQRAEHAPRSMTRQRQRLGRLQQDELPALEESIIEFIESPDSDVPLEHLKEIRVWVSRTSLQVSRTIGEFDTLLPWVATLAEPPELYRDDHAPLELSQRWYDLVESLDYTPSLQTAGRFYDRARARLEHLQHVLRTVDSADVRKDAAAEWNRQLAARLDQASSTAKEIADSLHRIRTCAASLSDEVDFGFLYDRDRHLFHIGYNVTAGQLDSNYYDLLASEARIASVVAIAKGDVPESHWIHLGRPFGRVEGSKVVLSWGGTMFEYLMPALLMELPPQTLLGTSSRVAVRRQQSYARRRNVPWGLSESAFYHFNQDGHYQYRAFGVPGLGLKRTLGDRVVIAPYASLLALSMVPRDVASNVDRLGKLGMLGRYGLYEAIDFAAGGNGGTPRGSPVRAYMSHHQGMILLSLTNYFTGNVMVRRFHQDPRIASVEYLLHEQAPRHVVPLEVWRTVAVRTAVPVQRVRYAAWSVPSTAPVQPVHLLSNGRYAVLLSSGGGGGSRWQRQAVTRWRVEPFVDAWGQWLYLQDLEKGTLWSIGHHPVGEGEVERDVQFAPHAAEYRARADHIAARVTVTVPPGDDVELRRVVLTNESMEPRSIALTSFFEVALAHPADDLRHQAFTKLFVESEILEPGLLFFRRRPRTREDRGFWVGHGVLLHRNDNVSVSSETDRRRFIGRGGTVRRPLALGRNGLSGTAGTVLDPAAAIRYRVRMKPGEDLETVFFTIAAHTRDELLARIEVYRSWSRIDWAYEEAAVHTEAQLNAIGMGADDIRLAQTLFSIVISPESTMRAAEDVLRSERAAQPALWSHGISGDLPILTVRLTLHEKLSLIREVLRAHAYLRLRGCEIDVVLMDESSGGYHQPLFDRLVALIAEEGAAALHGRRGGVFPIRAADLPANERRLLESSSRAVLDAQAGGLEQQLARLQRRPTWPHPLVPVPHAPWRAEPTPHLLRPPDLLFDNGSGGFTPDGREYVVWLDQHRAPPRPWINVVANPLFGFYASESGEMCTWSVNSSERRLTPWRNDPVTERAGEALYLRDEETGIVWSPTKNPAGTDEPYETRFGAGYVQYHHHAHGLEQECRMFVPPDDPVKIVRVKIVNHWHRVRRITLTYYAEWVVGDSRHRTAPHLVCDYSAEDGAILARNPFHPDFAGRVAFLASSGTPHGFTTDRIEFLGHSGDASRPEALTRIGLAGTVQPGIDCCGALQLHVDLHPGQERELHFLLGDGDDREHALRLARRYRSAEAIDAAWQGVRRQWDDLLDAVRVRTPERAVDLMLNRWLLYQTVACRLWGRTALFQSGGAFGYRDQLQDVMALAATMPHLAREHVLRAAGKQFSAGDVLHWWHPGTSRGVRTRCSDDLLWLPYAVAHYAKVTGDVTIWDEVVPFLEGKLLDPGETDRYAKYEASDESATVYEHCLRAIERATAVGAHGLPFIGSGDWNDGMNRVGLEGKGESVWLGWFSCAVLDALARVCRVRGDNTVFADFEKRRAKLVEALETEGWDGEWYRRAYYDDGTPLGSRVNNECRIDSIAQSWAVISGAGRIDRCRTAMSAVQRELMDEEERLIKLFAPPFDRTERDPGYIKGYPPGVRENGGQYTHAATWVAWAFGVLGDGDMVGKLFGWLNPIMHTETAKQVERYRGEPYAVAGDVSTASLHEGAAGWTWYTGSAAWMYRLGVELMLGMHKEAEELVIDPRIPAAWSEYEVWWQHGGATYHIIVRNPHGVCAGPGSVVLDGRKLDGNRVPLVDDGDEHEVEVELQP